jgi:hypothetical protein
MEDVLIRYDSSINMPKLGRKYEKLNIGSENVATAILPK